MRGPVNGSSTTGHAGPADTAASRTTQLESEGRGLPSDLVAYALWARSGQHPRLDSGQCSMLAGWVLLLAGGDCDGHILVRMDPVSHKNLAADRSTV